MTMVDPDAPFANFLDNLLGLGALLLNMHGMETAASPQIHAPLLAFIAFKPPTEQSVVTVKRLLVVIPVVKVERRHMCFVPLLITKAQVEVEADHNDEQGIGLGKRQVVAGRKQGG